MTFLGYTIYNAKKYSGYNNKWDLAQAHLKYAEQIPDTIRVNIKESMRDHLSNEQLEAPIGGVAVMHTHNTFPSIAQNYNTPMWKVPELQNIEEEHKNTVRGAKARYIETKTHYIEFCNDLLKRIALLG